MITADTITDEQIRELRAWMERGIEDWRLALEIHSNTAVALNEPWSARRSNGCDVEAVNPAPYQVAAARRALRRDPQRPRGGQVVTDFDSESPTVPVPVESLAEIAAAWLAQLKEQQCV